MAAFQVAFREFEVTIEGDIRDMGWSVGSTVAETLIRSIKKHVKDPGDRVGIYQDLIDALEERDWDSHSDVIGIDTVFDEVLFAHDPSLFSDEEE